MDTKEAIELVKKVMFSELNVKYSDYQCVKIIEDAEKLYNETNKIIDKK